MRRSAKGNNRAEPATAEQATKRVDYSGLVALWGPDAAKHLLRAVERAYRNQPPRPVRPRDKSH